MSTIEQKPFLLNFIFLSKIIPVFGSDSVVKNGAALVAASLGAPLLSGILVEGHDRVGYLNH